MAGPVSTGHPFLPKLIVCLREGYDSGKFLADLGSGLTVAVVALPLAMALGIASGLTPERGLFTAIVAGFLISALGGSRYQIGGPTGAFVVIVAGAVDRYGYDGLAVATLMAGVMVAVMGFARLGSMVKFIPYPVTTGFTSGIAVIIASTQIKDFLGLRMESVPSEFVEKIRELAAHLPTWQPAAFGVAAGSLAVLMVVRRVIPRLPGPIVAVVLASIAVKLLHLPVETIGTRFGGIPRSLPLPHLPAFSFSQARDLIPVAATIALLVAIESLLSAVVADGMTGARHKSDCELVGQGVANVASVLFGGIPATGAIARTVTNIKSGARTPVSGMIHAAAILLMMLLLAPLASSVPLAALAAILMVVAWNMSEMGHFRSILRSPRSDRAVLLLTFSLTVLADLTVAVGVGMVLASLLFMKRMSEVSNIRALTQTESVDGASQLPGALAQRRLPDRVEAFEMTGPFFFGVADRLKDTLNTVARRPRVFVLHMRDVPAVDATGLHALEELYDKCRRQGITLLLAGVHAQPLFAMTESGLMERIGQQNMFDTFEAALEKSRELAGDLSA